LGVSYDDYKQAAGECSEDIIQTIASCVGVNIWEIYAFTVTGGRNGSRIPSHSAGGRNLRAETSHGSGSAQEALSIAMSLLLGNRTEEPNLNRGKGTLDQNDYLEFSYSIVTDYDYGRGYSYVLSHFYDFLSYRVVTGDFDTFLQHYAQDDAFPNILVGQTVIVSYNVIAPTYDDDGGDGGDGGGESGPQTSGLPLPTITGIAVGAGALLIGAVASLCCCFCNRHAGEWIICVAIFCRLSLLHAPC
jgi:hypothetical protein